MKIKVVYQNFFTNEGIKESWAIIINGKTRFVLSSKRELEAFLRGVGVNE